VFKLLCIYKNTIRANKNKYKNLPINYHRFALKIALKENFDSSLFSYYSINEQNAS
jgi:hypothetical protein